MKVVELAERRGFMVVLDDTSPPEARPRAACWGEILRYGAFCRELEIPEDSDREAFVLAAYRKWGREFPSHLLGEVSYAVWDPSDRTLIAVSDTAGSRPIYHASSGEKVAVSTDTRALRALPWVGSQVDDLTVVAWIVDGQQREDASFYANIKRLPGGCQLIARGGRVDVRRWWGPFFPADDAIKTQADFVARFRELLFDAVRDRLLLGGPVSIMLSGGFDSTAIAAVAAALSRESGMPEVNTVSAVFPGLACDESERIDIARAELALDGRIFEIVPAPVLAAQIQEYVELFDAPYVEEQGAFLGKLCDEAAQGGASAVIGGFGGDELVHDPYDPADILRDVGFRGSLPRLAARHGVSLVRAATMTGLAVPRIVFHASGLRQRLGMDRAHLFDLLNTRWRTIAQRARPPSFVRRQGLATYTDEMRWGYMSDPSTQWYLAWFIRFASRYGLHVRSPFHDRRLIAHVIAAPPHVRPAPSQRFPYKPTLCVPLADRVPSRLTSRAWKVNFDFYSNLVLDLSVDEFERSGNTLPWRCARYIKVHTVLRTIHEHRLTTQGIRRDTARQLLVLGGVHAWLGTLDCPVTSLHLNGVPMSDPSVKPEPQPAHVERLRYVAPTVQRLGRLNDLTLGSGATTKDAGGKRAGG